MGKKRSERERKDFSREVRESWECKNEISSGSESVDLM